MVMLFYIVLLSLKFADSSKALAAGGPPVSKVSLSCDSVNPYFLAEGFPASDLPSKPLLAKDLKACAAINNGGNVCCSIAIEKYLTNKIRDKHDETTKETLQHLQNILQIRAVRFHDFFNNLLKLSKKNFHEMFKKTYGILYEQNASVFIELFQELEKYYTKGSVDLDDVMDTFFNTLYQKMFTVLNSQYKFDNKYFECVSHHMKEMRPFGDVPQKLGVQIKRSFIATRAFSQALQIATDVLKNMQQLKSSNECATALARMSACPVCSGIPGRVLACNDMCENVMKGCLAQYTALDADWNHFIEALDKVADRLLGPFNIEMLVRPINLKISEAIMNFQENSNDVSQRVFSGCGRPVLGRRRRGASWRNKQEIDESKSFHFDKEKKSSLEEDEERSSSAIILDKLVKEIKQRIRDSKQFWLYLPYKLCSNGLSKLPDQNDKCWNGTHIDKYMLPLAAHGEIQSSNPEVRVTSPRVTIVREQIYALNSISNRLRSAFDGHDVEWVDTEETWTSGSGSGDSNLDSVTDDEDGLTEDGSGYEKTIKPIKPTDQNIVQLLDRVENSSSTTPSVEVDLIDKKLDKKTNFNVILTSKNVDKINSSQFPTSSGTAVIFQKSSLGLLFVILLPKVAVMLGISVADCL